MCMSCWAELGEPAIDTPAVRAAIALVDEVYEFSCVGGNLHIVIDDFNIDDDNLEFCAKQIADVRAGRPSTFADVAPEQLCAEEACLAALWPMSIDERASVLALRDEFPRYKAEREAAEAAEEQLPAPLVEYLKDF